MRRLQNEDCNMQIAKCRLQNADCKMQIVDSSTAGYKVQIADCRLQIVEGEGGGGVTSQPSSDGVRKISGLTSTHFC